MANLTKDWEEVPDEVFDEIRDDRLLSSINEIKTEMWSKIFIDKEWKLIRRKNVRN